MVPVHSPTCTIFADVSEIVVTGGQSGIQRVVRRILQQAERDTELPCRVEPVIAKAGRLWRLNDRGRVALAAIEVAGRTSRSAPLILERDTLWLRAIKWAMRLMPGLYDRFRRRKLERSFEGLVEQRPVLMGTEDYYVVIDSFWTRSSAPRVAAALKRSGHKVVAMVYDALMLTHDGYVDPDVSDRFAIGLRRMTDAGVALISISRTAAEEIGRAASPGRPLAVDYFHQGFDLPDIPASVPVSWPAGLWSASRTFLTVGTFEPRKNQAVVLRAFDDLWAAGSDAHLVMIGQVGVGSEAFVDDLSRHPRLGTSLFVVHHADDAAIRDAYRRASALIMPSFVEGFGLPLVEALGLGLPVIASDIPVFREIGSDTCRFFAPGSSEALVEAVGDVSTNLSEWRARAHTFDWLDWREATRRFVETVRRAGG